MISKKCFTKNFYFYILACVSWLLKHARRVSFLLKRKRWKKNCCGKWFPINETHCAMVYTAMWTNDRVPIRNWRRPLLFASFCFPTECFLVYSSDTLTLPFTEIWFDSRRNWVPMGGPETPPWAIFHSNPPSWLGWMSCRSFRGSRSCDCTRDISSLRFYSYLSICLKVNHNLTHDITNLEQCTN